MKNETIGKIMLVVVGVIILWIAWKNVDARVRDFGRANGDPNGKSWWNDFLGWISGGAFGVTVLPGGANTAGQARTNQGVMYPVSESSSANHIPQAGTASGTMDLSGNLSDNLPLLSGIGQNFSLLGAMALSPTELKSQFQNPTPGGPVASLLTNPNVSNNPLYDPIALVIGGQ